MIKLMALFLGSALLLGGCASAPPPRPTGNAAPETGGLRAAPRPDLRNTATVRERLPQTAGQSIYFTPDATEVPASARPLLVEWAGRLKADNRLTLILEAHTDDLGSQEYCLALSEKWASYVEEALVRLGVRSTQVYLHPQGSSNSGPCTTESCRAAWRRVDLRER